MGLEAIYRNGKTVYNIRVENSDRLNRGLKQVTLDGKILPNAEIRLADDKREHDVGLQMG